MSGNSNSKDESPNTTTSTLAVTPGPGLVAGHRLEWKFMKILECPVCLEVPLVPPIFQCISGHSFCAQCRPKLNQCSLCTKKFAITRNYVAEGLIQATLFPCKNEAEGCPQVLSGLDMSDHQKNCYFRPVICNDHRIQPCSDNPIEINHFIRHLRTKHRCSGYETELGTYDKIERSSLLKTGPWVLFYMKFDGKYFIKHTQTDDDCVYWWISVVGTPEEAQNYFADIRVLPQSDAKEHLKIEFTTLVHSFRDTFETATGVIPWGCALLPKGHLKRLCKVLVRSQCPASKADRFEWKMQFNIRKKEEPELEAGISELNLGDNAVVNG